MPTVTRAPFGLLDVGKTYQMLRGVLVLDQPGWLLEILHPDSSQNNISQIQRVHTLEFSSA